MKLKRRVLGELWEQLTLSGVIWRGGIGWAKKLVPGGGGP